MTIFTLHTGTVSIFIFTLSDYRKQALQRIFGCSGDILVGKLLHIVTCKLEAKLSPIDYAVLGSKDGRVLEKFWLEFGKLL